MYVIATKQRFEKNTDCWKDIFNRKSNEKIRKVETRK